MAADFISLQFKTAGLHPKKLSFQIEAADLPSSRSSNIFAYLNQHADSTVVVAAHYDHLGMGGSKSLEITRKGMHPGADDNASGVALMLELARGQVAQARGRYNILFVATSAHEIGLFGAKALVAQRKFSRLKIKRIINLDMIGRLSSTQTLRLSYCESAVGLDAIVQAGRNLGLNILRDDAHETVNDMTVYCDAHLPAISLTTGLHDDYHRTTDTPDKLNYAGMGLILQFCGKILGQD